jgi:hypothetical protein
LIVVDYTPELVRVQSQIVARMLPTLRKRTLREPLIG